MLMCTFLSSVCLFVNYRIYVEFLSAVWASACPVTSVLLLLVCAEAALLSPVKMVPYKLLAPRGPWVALHLEARLFPFVIFVLQMREGWARLDVAGPPWVLLGAAAGCFDFFSAVYLHTDVQHLQFKARLLEDSEFSQSLDNRFTSVMQLPEMSY